MGGAEVAPTAGAPSPASGLGVEQGVTPLSSQLLQGPREWTETSSKGRRGYVVRVADGATYYDGRWITSGGELD